MANTWRQHAANHIAEVVKQHPNAQGEALRKLLSANYPFGARKYHPYKVWLEEVKRVIEERRDFGYFLTGQQTPSTADYTDTPLFGGDA